MQQIDIVPTLALLLGVPIPYSNLGTVIEELFDSDDKRAQAVALNYEQISRLVFVGFIWNLGGYADVYFSSCANG